MDRISMPALAARFDSMATARRAIQALENAGIDGGDLELHGAAADRARAPGSPTEGLRPSERRAGRYIAPRVATGAIVTGASGAVMGLVVGLIVMAAAGASFGVAVACALAGALIGSVLGAYLRFERTVGFSREWQLTFEDTGPGPVWVAVRAADPDTQTRAAKLLERLDPIEVRTGDGAAR